MRLVSLKLASLCLEAFLSIFAPPRCVSFLLVVFTFPFISRLFSFVMATLKKKKSQLSIYRNRREFILEPLRVTLAWEHRFR